MPQLDFFIFFDESLTTFVVFFLFYIYFTFFFIPLLSKLRFFTFFINSYFFGKLYAKAIIFSYYKLKTKNVSELYSFKS